MDLGWLWRQLAASWGSEDFLVKVDKQVLE